jgi:spore germination cell wall hydrolase CwlJ-like protein
LFLFTKARPSARAFVAASLIGIAGAGGVGAVFLASGLTADVAPKPVSIPIAVAIRATSAYAAVQQSGVAQLRGPLMPALPLPPSPVNPAMLQAAAFQASAPFRLANPDAAAHDLDCLTAAVYYEARGESREGQAAVAQVVLNRVRSPAFPKTVCGVVFQGAVDHACQFSFACDGQMGARHEGGAWDRAKVVANRALGGYVMDEVGGATHFHVAALGSIWGGGMVRIAQVGQHIFYGFGGHRGAIPNATAHNSAAPPTLTPVSTAAKAPSAVTPTAAPDSPAALTAVAATAPISPTTAS